MIQPMIKAFISPSGSLYGAIPACLYTMGAVLLLMAPACGHDARTEHVSRSDAPVDSSGFAPTGNLITRIREATGLDVQVAHVGRQRTDITLSATAAHANPDSEQVALAALAKRLLRESQSEIQSETLAITVARPMRPDGAFERNTYFYYRSEIQRKKQP